MSHEKKTFQTVDLYNRFLRAKNYFKQPTPLCAECEVVLYKPTVVSHCDFQKQTLKHLIRSSVCLHCWRTNRAPACHRATWTGSGVFV